jgi:hypothetical protein
LRLINDAEIIDLLDAIGSMVKQTSGANISGSP